MAQLKDLIVTGPARIVGTLYAQNASTATAGLVKLGGGTTNFLRADGTWAAPPNTTYSANNGVSLSGTTFSNSGVRSIATGGTNGTISVNTNGSSAEVAVKGLGSAAYTASTAYATSGHTHATSIATSSGTNQITLAANTKYAITAGGTSYVFTTPPDNNTTYSANTGIKLNGTTFQHTNAVTAGTAGTSSATSGSTLAVPYVTYDAQGHITGSGTHTHTVSGFLTSSSSLDASKLTGTVPTSVLPSYVDDVLEYSAKSNFPSTGETGKIYVDTSTNLTYRWGGSAYVEISPSLAIGSTASTAAKGNHTHSVTAAGSISVQTAGTTTTIPNVTGVGSVPTTEDITCDDITAWSAGTTPSLGTAITADKISEWSVGTKPSLTITNQTVVTGTTVSNEVMSFNTTTNGSASGWSAGTTPYLSYATRSIPNVTSVGSVPSLTYTARTVKSVKSVGSTPTLGTAITVKTGDAAYKFTGSAVSTGVPA